MKIVVRKLAAVRLLPGAVVKAVYCDAPAPDNSVTPLHMHTSTDSARHTMARNLKSLAMAPGQCRRVADIQRQSRKDATRDRSSSVSRSLLFSS